MPYTAGVDWSLTAGHAAAAVTKDGDVAFQIHFDDSPAGVAQFLRAISDLAPNSHRFSRRQVPIAIEAGSTGLLVADLRRRGLTVIELTPGICTKYRARHNPGRAKDDRSDAVLLAQILRTDTAMVRPAWSPYLGGALTVYTRDHSMAVRQRTSTVNRLNSHLLTYFPAAAAAWRGLDRNLLRGEARAVIGEAPTPAMAAALSRARIRALLAQGGRTRLLDQHADRLFDHFRAKQLRHTGAIEDAMAIRTIQLLTELELHLAAIDELEHVALQEYQAHPLWPILHTFPASGSMLGAKIAAELGPDIGRFRTGRGLCAYAGVAPVTFQSGTSATVRRRYICNRQLCVVLHQWAFCTLTRSPGARALYQQRRDAGERHTPALRNLAHHLVRSVHYCLTHDDPYDELAAFPRPLDRSAAGHPCVNPDRAPGRRSLAGTGPAADPLQPSGQQ